MSQYRVIMILFLIAVWKEAEQWWKRHSQVDLRGHCKEEIEDLTGGIPLHLDQCVANGKINLRPLALVGAQAAVFAADTALKAKKDSNGDHWQLYVHLIQCL
jgi:hypothetical protein